MAAMVRSLLSSTALARTSTAAALLAGVCLGPTATQAQDATWLANPGSADFNAAANWSPATVPTGTAFFGTSSTTNLSFSAFNTTIGGWTFNAGASDYTFTAGGGFFHQLHRRRHRDQWRQRQHHFQRWPQFLQRQHGWQRHHHQHRHRDH
ncbi:hypothetical protein [Bradyrhizobium sp. NAS80.1]|uniref:hypothetical protein n=1 Tax=Bradyrhizobium sp. NAS80.1 TaxID=1680159 RepID=UPI001FDAA942|nr:hypothetical protein [Bradyrhizobium sp. NAS80.1]